MSATILAISHTTPATWELMEKTGSDEYTIMARFVSAKQAARFHDITKLAADPSCEVLLEIRLPQNEIDLLNNYAKFTPKEAAE